MRLSKTIYFLPLIPTVTEVIEIGHLPQTPRNWITDITMTLVVGAMVWRIRLKEEALKKLSQTDGLTGLKNKRTFHIDLKSEVDRARRMNTSLIIAFLDVDHFKAVNDTHGHQIGDKLLQELAKIVAAGVRQATDRSYRIGGDEFIVLMPQKNENAIEGSEQTMNKIMESAIGMLKPWGAGLSIGLTRLNQEESAEDFLNRADELMYKQKQINHSKNVDES